MTWAKLNFLFFLEERHTQCINNDNMEIWSRFMLYVERGMCTIKVLPRNRIKDEDWIFVSKFL